VSKVLGNPNHPIAHDYADSYCVVLGIKNDFAMRRRVHKALLCGIGGVIIGSGFARSVRIGAVQCQSFGKNRFMGELMGECPLNHHQLSVSARRCLQSGVFLQKRQAMLAACQVNELNELALCRCIVFISGEGTVGCHNSRQNCHSA